MHDVLARQLRRLGLAETDDPMLLRLFERVSERYRRADRERGKLKDALELASAGMRQVYEQTQAASEQRYQELFENANDVIYTVTLDGYFTSANRAAERITGYDRSELIGQHFAKVVPPEQVPFVAEMTRRKVQGDSEVTRFEIDMMTKSGGRIPLELNTRIIFKDGRPFEIQGLGRDVSERRNHEKRLQYVADHDALTGLGNRNLLEAALKDPLAADPQGRGAVLLFLDLDNFKLVNDSLGHAAGDAVLVRVARLLSQMTRPGDLLIRLGGDEFAVLLKEVTTHEASAIAERFRTAVEGADVSVDGQRFYLGASIGIAPVAAEVDRSLLLSRADAAMYRAKERGRNRVVWAGSDDHEGARLAEASQLAAEIRLAIAEGRFEVHYQPIVRLADSRVAHYEALVRMRRESGDLAAPAAFMFAAEHFGLISQIDRHVIDAAMDLLSERSQLRIFVNLSGNSMAEPALLDHIASRLRAHPSLGPRLGFEITETAVVKDLEVAGNWMAQLGGQGCQFALDDFGTGFSSLTYVRSLPVTQIKLDASFVRTLPTDSKQRAVVSAVQALAEVLKMETVAECVESAATMRVCREIGITFGQGFYFGRPARRLRRPATIAA